MYVINWAGQSDATLIGTLADRPRPPLRWPTAGATVSTPSCVVQTQEGHSLHGDRYTLPGDGLSNRTLTLAMQFDAGHGLPTAATAEGSAAQHRFTATTRFAFDRRIEVERLAGAGKP